ncbi:uncharacterized protein B0T23DRAFT_384974, partial [Neurospora hispaniola]
MGDFRDVLVTFWCLRLIWYVMVLLRSGISINFGFSLECLMDRRNDQQVHCFLSIVLYLLYCSALVILFLASSFCFHSGAEG